MLDATLEASRVMQMLSGDYADRYIGELLLPVLASALQMPSANAAALKARFLDPFHGLIAIFANYAFSRRGRESSDLAKLGVEALRRTTSAETIADFLQQPDASNLWRSFSDVAAAAGRKVPAQLNRGVIAGLAELAQEIFRIDSDGSISRWLVDSTLKTDRVETQFMRLVDIRGVGPKLSSLLLRDVALLFDLERTIDHADRLYLQPIDRWIRLAAPKLIADENAAHYADWILAGKLSKAARQAGVSGVRLNMGISFLGTRYPAPDEVFQRKIIELGNPLLRSQVRQHV